MFFLYAFAVQHKGIDHRNQNHRKNSDKQKPHAAKKGGQDHNKTTSHPEPAGKPVGFIPVFFAFQRPGDFDTNGIVLFDLGKEVADDHKKQSHKQL